jgi:hypothetical protein
LLADFLKTGAVGVGTDVWPYGVLLLQLLTAWPAMWLTKDEAIAALGGLVAPQGPGEAAGAGQDWAKIVRDLGKAVMAEDTTSISLPQLWGLAARRGVNLLHLSCRLQPAWFPADEQERARAQDACRAVASAAKQCLMKQRSDRCSMAAAVKKLQT